LQVYQTLAAVLTEMSKQELKEKRVEFKVINPKAITMGQLYGQFDPITHEWTDGILANTFRSFAQQGVAERKWIVFDGPVDAIWVENMNTVLDDNKKLCLTSGEIMSMSNTMSIQFEVADLAVASPATVSRCGMIYLEAESMGWIPLTKSWIKVLPKGVSGDQRIMLESLFMWIVPPSLKFLTDACREVVSTSHQNMVYSLMNLISCQIDIFDTAEIDQILPNVQNVWLTNAFIFATIWSLGGTIDAKSRSEFDLFFKELLQGKNLEHPVPKTVKIERPLPLQGLIYDFVFEKDKKVGGDWKLWVDTIGQSAIPNKANFSTITVPTIDTARYAYLLDLFITHNKQVLIVGPTGTGKSVYINNKLLNGLPKEGYTPVFINFSAQTTAKQTQDIILNKMEKRRKGVYGPPPGQKCVIFVDDMNMPAREKYGAKPPIELLRQRYH
jgi:dynein heavy chain, axonemal